VKHFFYTILLVASLGGIVAIVNPPLIKQGATLIGLDLPLNSPEPEEELSEEDQLAKFLAQYPFANGQDSTVVPATNVPMVVIPEPTHQQIPPVYEVPTPPQAWDQSHWNGAVAAPIDPPPVVEDWSGPSQPYQTPAPPPQQSVYSVGTQEDVFPVVQDVPSFERTSYASHPPAKPPASVMYQTPTALVENVPVHGTEMVARVGTQVILMGDILPKLRRLALQIASEYVKAMSEEERERISQQEIEQDMNKFIAQSYPEVLKEQIIFALVYNDYEFSQDKTSQGIFNDRMGEEFERIEIPAMMQEFNVTNLAALKKYLEEQLGSSLEKEKRQWIREQIVKQWINMSMQRATGDSTHDEMKDFYERNKAMFTSTTRARWQEMVVLLSNYNTEQEAWKKIRWMGNQVAGGAPFEEIAKANSDGFTASDGGIWDWTTQGSLTSAELEQAIFSQPIGQLSPAIIKSDKGLHIVRVLEREESTVVPLVEAQPMIREKIKNQRAQRYQDEYLADLRRRFPTIVVKDRIDFNVSRGIDAGAPIF